MQVGETKEMTEVFTSQNLTPTLFCNTYPHLIDCFIFKTVQRNKSACEGFQELSVILFLNNIFLLTINEIEVIYGK
jgi:hypothetical protein